MWRGSEGEVASCATTTSASQELLTSIDPGGSNIPTSVPVAPTRLAQQTSATSSSSFLETIPPTSSSALFPDSVLPTSSSALGQPHSSLPLGQPTPSPSSSAKSEPTSHPSDSGASSLESHVVIPVLVAVIILILLTGAGVYLRLRRRARKPAMIDVTSGEPRLCTCSALTNDADAALLADTSMRPKEHAPPVSPAPEPARSSCFSEPYQYDSTSEEHRSNVVADSPPYVASAWNPAQLNRLDVPDAPLGPLWPGTLPSSQHLPARDLSTRVSMGRRMSTSQPHPSAPMEIFDTQVQDEKIDGRVELARSVSSNNSLASTQPPPYEP